jgi:CreA protein
MFRYRTLLPALLLLALAACGQRNSKDVGEFSNDWSGNEIVVEALKDPKVEGVTCHLSHFDRGFWDRMSKGNWFENPSNASIACHQTGPIKIGKIEKKPKGEAIFSARQSLVFKSITVRRIYDAENNLLVYVVYSRRPLDVSAKMSLSSVPLWRSGAEPSAD